MNSPPKSNPETASADLVARGQNTYRQRLASILEPSHIGEFVAVEPDSGRYFLGGTASAALVAAHAAMPNNLFYLTRVGRDTAHTVRGVSKVDYFGVRRQEHPSAAAAPGPRTSPLSKALTSQRTPKLPSSFPAIQHFINALGNRAPGVRSIPASAEKLIVVGFAMPNMSDYRKSHYLII